MIKEIITRYWNADPNAPDVELYVDGTTVSLEFFVNGFRFESFDEGDKAVVTFSNCYKYAFNHMNDEDYYLGQYRYKYTTLPWGEFYLLDTDWQTDFPSEHVVLDSVPDVLRLNHYIFFFKDNTFECVAEGYRVDFLKKEEIG